MTNIGGNIEAILQIKSTEKNEIGEAEKTWVDAHSLTGWLDLQSGDSTTNFNAKTQESTHIFLCDYEPLEGINTDNARMVINSEVYEIQLIDNPMNMNQHLEIYLKYIGGGLGV